MERICVLCNTSKTCFGGWHRFEQKEDGTFHSGTIDWIISKPSIPLEKTKNRMYLCNACWSPNFHAFRKIKPGGKKKGPKHKRNEEEEDEEEEERERISFELRIKEEEEEKLRKIKETEERLKKIREEEEIRIKEEQERKQLLKQEEQKRNKIKDQNAILKEKDKKHKKTKNYVVRNDRSCIICNTNSTCKNGWNTFKLRDGKFYNGTTIEWIISTPIISNEDLQKDMWTCNACWNKNYWAFRRLRDQENGINVEGHMPLKKRKIILQSIKQKEMSVDAFIADSSRNDNSVEEELMEINSQRILDSLGKERISQEELSCMSNDHNVVGAAPLWRN